MASGALVLVEGTHLDGRRRFLIEDVRRAWRVPVTPRDLAVLSEQAARWELQSVERELRARAILEHEAWRQRPWYLRLLGAGHPLIGACRECGAS